MNRSRWLLVGLVASAVALVANLLGRALSDAAARARDVPLSPLTGGWRVGADYPERRGIVADGAAEDGAVEDGAVAEEEVTGEMDDLSAFAGPTFDPEEVAPEVQKFYERTADYALAYDVRWHRPFLLGAALASRLTSRVEQLNLPGPTLYPPGPSESGSGPESEQATESGVRELESRFVRVDPAADPREGARAWVRTRADGTAVFVAIYAHHEREQSTGGEPIRYVNIAAPLPGANLSTVLRPENLDDGSGGLELTTFGSSGLDGGGEDERDSTGSDGNDGDEGLYLVTPLGAFDLPLDQRFRVRPADDHEGEPDATGGDSAVVATHEMWLFGRQFLTIRYVARTEE